MSATYDLHEHVPGLAELDSRIAALDKSRRELAEKMLRTTDEHAKAMNTWHRRRAETIATGTLADLEPAPQPPPPPSVTPGELYNLSEKLAHERRALIADHAQEAIAAIRAAEAQMLSDFAGHMPVEEAAEVAERLGGLADALSQVTRAAARLSGAAGDIRPTSGQAPSASDVMRAVLDQQPALT